MDYVAVDCQVSHKTEKAVLIHYISDSGEPKECWLPLSMCEAPDTIEPDDEEIRVARWLAVDRGLIEESGRTG